VVLDLSFLPPMYKDEVRTPFVDLPRKLLATIEDRGLDLSRLRLWVADRDRVPLAHGYLPNLASEMVRNPGSFRGEIPRKWRELRQGEYLAFFSAYEEAVPHLQKYLEEVPEDPSVLFLLAQLHFVDREIERGLRFLHRAFKADAYYIRGHREAALQYFRKGELENAERVLRAGLLQDPFTPDLKQGLAYVLLEQAKKLLPLDPSGAEARVAEIDAVGVGDDFLRQVRAHWEKEKTAPGEMAPPPAGMSTHGHGLPGGRAE
jgi:tetratricopeptide (TPR) repeat protein